MLYTQNYNARCHFYLNKKMKIKIKQKKNWRKRGRRKCLGMMETLTLLILFMVFLAGYAKLEKAMAPHSSTLAWKIPWTEEPGGLQSMVLWRVGHNWATSLSLSTFMHWRRNWQPTPVFLPGESQGWRSVVGCRLWGCTESDTIEVMQQQQQLQQDMHMGKRIEMDNLNTCSLLYSIVSP